MSQYHTYPSTKGQMKKLISFDWPQQQPIPQEHRVLAWNPKDHTALGLSVPVWNRNNSADNLEEYNWLKLESDYCSKKSPNLSSEPPRASFYFLEEVGHESSSSSKLPAPDPEPCMLHTNWSCVLPVCLEWERGGHPAEDAVCVPLTANGKNTAQHKQRSCCAEKNWMVCRDSHQKQPTFGERRKKKQHLLKMFFTNQFTSACIVSMLFSKSWLPCQLKKPYLCGVISCPAQSSSIMRYFVKLFV